MTPSIVPILVNTGPLASEVADHLKQLGRLVLLAADADEGLTAVLPEGDLVLVPFAHLGAVCRTVERATGPDRSRLPVLAITSSDEEGAEPDDALDDSIPWPGGRGQLVRRMEMAVRRCAERHELDLRRTCTQTLLELAGTLAASVEYEDLLHETLARLTDSTEAIASLVMVKSQDDKLFYVLGSSEDLLPVKYPVEPENYPEVREALTKQQALFLDLKTVEPDTAAALENRQIGAVFVLPLNWRGEAYGVLELCFEHWPRMPTPLTDLTHTAASLIASTLRTSELYASLHEQTKKRTAEEREAQRQMELVQRYEDFFQRSFDGILVLDRRRRVLYINPAGEQITGYARHGLVGSDMIEIVEEQDREMLVGIIAEITDQGVAGTFDLGLVTTSEDSIIASVSPSAVLEDDEVLVLSFRDVTEARALENELRSTKDFLERLIDSTVDAIVATDVNGQVVHFNKGAEIMFDMHNSDVVGKLYLEDLYPPGVAAKLIEQLRSPEDGGVGRLQSVRKEILNDHQERVPVSVSAGLIYDEDREVGTVAILSDLRDRLRIEMRLAQAQEKLVMTEKQALIAELAGTTAHELNQPLTSVMGYAELLKRRVDRDDLNFRAVDTILKEAERMAEIVRKIGKITRYETKTYVGGTQILDLEKSSEE